MRINHSEAKALQELVDFAFSCHQELAFRGEHINETPPQIKQVRAMLKKDKPKTKNDYYYGNNDDGTCMFCDPYYCDYCDTFEEGYIDER